MSQIDQKPLLRAPSGAWADGGTPAHAPDTTPREPRHVTTPEQTLELPDLPLRPAVRAALEEDFGRAGDITSAAIIPADATARAVIAARATGRVAGLRLVEAVFETLDPETNVETIVAEGAAVSPGDVVVRLAGRARTLLAGERTALNYLCHLSGIATLTSTFVTAVDGTGARICCTRKTTPGLRLFEKFAVRAGGGVNHRFGLDDAVLIKDNHIAAAGGVTAAIERALAASGHMVTIEVEVDTLAQLEEALAHPIDAVLLDNMSPEMLRKAVAMVRERGQGRVVAEASGGVNLETVRAVAETGVDLISAGALTHSSAALDFGLDFED